MSCGARCAAAAPTAGVVIILTASWVAMGELIQGMQAGWAKPWCITYVVHGSFALCLLPWLVLRYLRSGYIGWWWRTSRSQTLGIPQTGGGGGGGADVVLPVPPRQLVILALLLQALSALNGFTWYLSLPHTLVAANNAIYQSASSVVFLLSIPVLGERVRWHKVVAVAVCITGVVLVSFAPSSSSAATSSVQETPAGYAWVMASTVGYGVYEVIYSRFSEQRVVSCGDVCRRGFIGAHARRELADEAQAAASEEASEPAAAADGRPLAPASSAVAPGTAGGDAVLGGIGGDDLAASTSAFKSPRAEDRAALLLPRDSADGGGDAAVTAHAHPSTLLHAEVAAWMLGSMGVMTYLTLWPIFFLLHYTGVETFEMPPAGKGRLLALSAVLDGLYNVTLLFGVLITSPLWMAVSTVLVVPGSLLADWLIHHATVSGQAAGGILLIITGFALLQLPATAVRRVETACRRGAASTFNAAHSCCMAARLPPAAPA